MATYAAKQKVLSSVTQSDLRSELLYPDLHGGASGIGASECQSIEKKLIGFSLGIGLFLIALLAIANHLFPSSL